MKNRGKVLFGLGVGVGVAIILILVFLAGVYFGSCNRNNIFPSSFPFWERRMHMPNGFVPDKFGHGVVGSIDSLGDNTFVVKDRSGGLKTILVDDKTQLRQDGLAIKFTDLKKDDKVIILGEPKEEEGAISARIVRVLTEFKKR